LARQVIGRRLNFTAGSFRTRRTLRRKNFSKFRDLQKQWRSFKVCCWVWWREKRELI